MNRAAVYVRVSTEGQREGTSLDSQKAWCLAEVDRLGYQPGETYEEAASGSRADRPEWSRLMADAKSGQFVAVVAYDLDRLHRDLLNGLTALRDLESVGVAVHDSKTTGNATSADNQLMTGFRLLLAQEERRKILERTIRGQRARAVSGWPGGQPSLGWRLDGKGKTARPVPDPAEREAIARMVELVLAGQTCGQIADRLNAEQVPTRTGAPWSHTVVRRALKNPTIWNGEHRWGGTGKANGRYSKTATDRNGKPKHGDPVTILLPDPPLDQTTWEAVQAVLDASPRAGRKQDNQISQLLTGRVYGTCDRHYLGTMVKQRSGDTAAKYRPQCQRRPHLNQPECDCRQTDAAKLDELVWGRVAEVLGDKDRLQRLASEWLAQATIPEADARELEALEERLRVLDRAIKRASDQAFLAEEPEELLARVAAYRDEKVSLVSRRASLMSVGPEARRASERLSDMVALADRAASRLRSMTREQRREVLALLEVRVVVAGPHRDGLPESVAIHGVLDPRAA